MSKNRFLFLRDLAKSEFLYLHLFMFSLIKFIHLVIARSPIGDGGGGGI
jgi:hypothetical protein